MSDSTRVTRAVFLFHGSAEIRPVRNRPKRGGRVKSSRGDEWIVADVLQSGVDTYTVTCVAPGEFERSARACRRVHQAGSGVSPEHAALGAAGCRDVEPCYVRLGFRSLS